MGSIVKIFLSTGPTTVFAEVEAPEEAAEENMLEVVVGVAKRLVVVTTVVRSAPEFIWNIYRNDCGYLFQR